MISPKDIFLKQHKEQAEKFANIVADPVFKNALVFAHSTYCASGVSADQLKGANEFVDILVSLASPPKPTHFPSKSLTSDLSGVLKQLK